VRTTRSLLAVFCIVAVTAACSKNDTGTAQPAPLVEKSSAIAAGDAICKQMTADITSLVASFKKDHPSPSDAEARDFLVNTLLPRIDTADGAIHRIGEPTKDRAAFDDAVIALDKDVSALKEAVAGNPAKVLTTPVVVFDKSARLFSAYGFKECGKTAPG
jgi:hypothetical protein